MKYIKTYENNINYPKTDDFVIIQYRGEYDEKDTLNLFLSNNIGKVLDDDGISIKIIYFMKKSDIPYDSIYACFSAGGIGKCSINLSKTHVDIIGFSENKKDLEHIINANKYNL